MKCAAGNHDAYLSPIGITFEEFLNQDTNTRARSFLIGQDLETVAHAGVTGEDFGGGARFFWMLSTAATERICKASATSSWCARPR